MPATSAGMTWWVRIGTVSPGVFSHAHSAVLLARLPPRHCARPALVSSQFLQSREPGPMSFTSVAPRDNVAAGIGWMLLTTFLFIAMDTLAKYLLHLYPAAQVIWARFFFHLLLAMAIMGPSLLSGIRSARPMLQHARSVLLL